MKLLSCCTECLINNDVKNNDFSQFYIINYNEGICEYTCKNGHKNRFIVQNEKYELLFDSAIVAYYDGYNRECVLNVSSALECFYDYAIGAIIFFKNKGDYSDVQKFMNNIDKRSECREGTFYGICKIVFGENLAIKKEMKELRNGVIHNGKFPTEKEAIEYAKIVFEIIIKSIKLIDGLVDKDTLIKYDSVRINKKQTSSDVPYGLHFIPTFIGAGSNGSSFEQELNSFKKRIEYCYGINIEK